MEKTSLILSTGLTVLISLSAFYAAAQTAVGIGEDKGAPASFVDRKSIEKAQQLFMELFKKGDSIGVANGYTIDAKVMSAGSPATNGHENIIKFFGKIFRSGPKIITVETYDTWSDGDLVVEEGKWIMADKDGKEYDHGKYLILWKMENGRWKKFRDCHNSDIYPLPK